MLTISAIARIDIFQPFPRDVGKPVYPLDRRGRHIAHQVAWEETGEVQGDLGAYGGEPGGQLPHLMLAVVAAGDEERSHLQVTGPRRKLYGAHDCTEVPAQAAVPVFSEALEVNIHGVDEREQLLPGLGLDRAVSDKDVHKARLSRQGGAVADVLKTDQRLVVGVGQADIPARAQPEGQLHKLFRRAVARRKVLARGGYLRVLAKGAAQVAAETARGEDETAGAKAAQGLLFDGVEGEGGQPCVAQRDDSPAPVRPRAAQARLPLGQPAAVEAEAALCAHLCLTTSKRASS